MFLLCFILYLRTISEYKVPGGLYLEGQFNGGFFALRVWGSYIWRGYTWRGLFSEFYSMYADFQNNLILLLRKTIRPSLLLVDVIVEINKIMYLNT